MRCYQTLANLELKTPNIWAINVRLIIGALNATPLHHIPGLICQSDVGHIERGAFLAGLRND